MTDKFPPWIQPIVVVDGVTRFQQNDIVRHLLDTHPTVDLNKIAIMEFADEDRRQFAQLIGYSIAGYGELDYVRDDDFARAEATAPAERRPPPAGVTFDSKLKQMQDDLHSVVTRMANDRSYDVATQAMTAAQIINCLRKGIETGFGDELAWDWTPAQDDDNG